MTINLKEMFRRAETWSAEDQEKLARIMLEIEAGEHEPYQPTEEDLRAIDEGVAAAERGEFANEDQVAALLARFRRS